MSRHYEGQAVDFSEVPDHSTIIPEFGDGSLTSSTDEKDNFELDDGKNKRLSVPNNSTSNKTNISAICIDQKDQGYTTGQIVSTDGYSYIVPDIVLKSPPQKHPINDCVKQEEHFLVPNNVEGTRKVTLERKVETMEESSDNQASGLFAETCIDVDGEIWGHNVKANDKQVTFQSPDSIDCVHDTKARGSNEKICDASGLAKLRAKSRACSSIRRIQEKLQIATSEQCQSVQRNMKSTAMPSNTSGLNMIRRQRSRSRASKFGRHGVMLIQRPYRRWLGVSTCLSDARYIVSSKKKSAYKPTSPDTCINSSGKKRDPDVQATCNSDQENLSVEKNMENILSDELNSQAIENTGFLSPVNGFTQNKSPTIPLTDDERCLENLQGPIPSSSLNATISLSNFENNIQNSEDEEHHSSKTETDEIQSYHSLQRDIEKLRKNVETSFTFEDEKLYCERGEKNPCPAQSKRQRCSSSPTVQIKESKCKPSDKHEFVYEDEGRCIMDGTKIQSPIESRIRRCCPSPTVLIKESKCKPFDENESVYEEEGLDIMDEAGNLKKSQQEKNDNSPKCKPLVKTPVSSGVRMKRIKIARSKNHPLLNPRQEYQKSHDHDPLPAGVWIKKRIKRQPGLSSSSGSKSAVLSLDPDKDSFRQDGGLAGNVVAITRYQFMDPPPVLITQEKRGRQRARNAIPFDGINGINPLREEMRQYLELGLHPTRPKPTPSSALQRLVKRPHRKDGSRSRPKAEYYNVQAIKSFEGKLPGQLSFEKGQIIKQLDTGLSPKNGMNYGYYRVGRLKRKKAGLYPCSHVTCQVEDDDE